MTWIPETEAPRLRDDLVVSQQRVRGAATVVVKDPGSDRFFRFGEVEHFILQQLDGRTPLAAVGSRAEARFGTPLAARELEGFVARLRQCGLLAGASAAAVAPPRGRVRGHLFYLRLKAVDPDRFLDRLLPRLRCLFTPQFVALALAAVFLALATTAVHRSAIAGELWSIVRLHSLAAAWLVIAVSITLHELAHGLTCKAFGGRVREMGFMLLYFSPAFYCNVSDAWLLPRKAQRLWVTFAGPFFDLFVWAVATLVWRVTEPGGLLAYVALVVMGTTLVRTFFNLNPLIKLDGYYLLSDLLEVPNLHARAFGYLRQRLRALCRLCGIAKGQDPAEAPLSGRERLVYALYGVLAGAYTYWFLSLVIAHVGGWLVSHYQGWGFVLFAGLLAMLFRRPLAAVGRGARRLPTRIAAVLRQPSRLGRRHLIGGAMLAGAVAGLGWGQAAMTVGGTFTLRPDHNADVRSRVAGIVDSVGVAQGDSVGVGQILATLADGESRTQLAEVEAHLGQEEARLRLLLAGPRPVELAQARTSVERAAHRLEFARSQLRADSLLFDRQALSLQALRQSQEAVALGRLDLEAARQDLELLQAGARQEEIEALEATLEGLRARRGQLRQQLPDFLLRSPIRGVVTTPDLDQVIGRYVEPGDLVLEVYDLTMVTVEISMPEKEVAEVRIDQPVTLKAAAYPHLTFAGRVTRVAPVAQADSLWRDRSLVRVQSEIDNAAGLLRPGMTGYAKIDLGERPLAQLLSGRLLRALRVEVWTWW